MVGQREPRLVGEEPDAEIPDNAGDVFGKPGPNGIVHLLPFDIRDGEIGFASDGSLCAVVTNGNRWISLRFSAPIAMVVGEKLLECVAKMTKVH